MKNEIYDQIYKCRMCGEAFREGATRGREKALEYMDDFLKIASGASHDMLCWAPEPRITHFCLKGDFGVADFVGYRKRVESDD